MPGVRPPARAPLAPSGSEYVIKRSLALSRTRGAAPTVCPRLRFHGADSHALGRLRDARPDTHALTHAPLCMHMEVDTYIHIHTSIYTYMYIYKYTNMRRYTYLYIHMPTYTYTYKYICMHTGIRYSEQQMPSLPRAEVGSTAPASPLPKAT